MADKLHIVIVDDHPIFRDGLVQTLAAEPGFEVVGQAATAAEAIRLTADLLPDLLLLDLDIPGGGGLNVARTVAVQAPVTKIVLLTGSDDEDNLLAGLRAGARAYVLKGVAARELVSILRFVAAGEVYVTPTLAAGLLMEMTAGGKSAAQNNPLDQLTERERQVLELVASGLSNKEIGLQLHLTEKTIKHVMTNVLQKLQVRNRLEAALLLQKSERRG